MAVRVLLAHIAATVAQDAPTLNFVSATLGDGMVLQRAPKQAVVWGHTTPGATVTTTFNSKTFTAVADADGTWRQLLPAMAASLQGYDLEFVSTAGEHGELQGVLFGDVYLCGGQSNMAFAMPAATNSSAEAELANDYPHVRLFTVGRDTGSIYEPLNDLQTVVQPWSVANATTVRHGGGWDEFSAVCWFFGRRIADSLGPKVPVGLISNNWGGTRIEEWMTQDTLEKCVSKGRAGGHYNAMINPYVVGPMALTGFAWYQGEQNTRDQAAADSYACLFPEMITAWRAAFQDPDAFFGFVQISTWCNWGLGVPELREAQMAATALKKIGFATNADHGAGCNIHPADKQYIGARLGDSALALEYGQPIAWKSPSYSGAQVDSSNMDAISVTIALQDVSKQGLTADVYPYNYEHMSPATCVAKNVNNTLVCAWAAMQFGNGEWVNATVAVDQSGQALTLTAPASSGQSDVVATSYGWGPVPMLNAYDQGTNLPVLPWNRTLKEFVLV